MGYNSLYCNELWIFIGCKPTYCLQQAPKSGVKWGSEVPVGYGGFMELSAEQEAAFRGLCKEIKPGEYGRVVVSFVGEPSNLVSITAEKTFRFHNEKAEASTGESLGRRGSGRY
jgi:hypothetical protein